MSEPTPTPWKAQRTNWRGEPSPHDIYISGGEYVDEPEDSDDEDAESITVATGVAIVCGNATSKGVTAANAELIVLAVNVHDALVAALETALEIWGRQSSFYAADPLIARAVIDMEAALAAAQPRELTTTDPN